MYQENSCTSKQSPVGIAPHLSNKVLVMIVMMIVMRMMMAIAMMTMVMMLMMKLHLLDRCVKRAVPVEGRNSKLGKVNLLDD